MKVNLSNKKNGIQINIKGRLDTVNAPVLEKTITPILKGEMKNVTINCAQLDYISSSGLRLFLTLQKAALAKEGKLTLIGLKAEIMEIFEMTGFSSIFHIE